MSITFDEIRIQLALGTFDPALYPEIYHIDDQDILTFLAFCDNVVLRRVAAANPNTPFSVHYKQYMKDPDFLVKECAWEHTRSRFIRRFHIEPLMLRNIHERKNIDPYDIPE